VFPGGGGRGRSGGGGGGPPLMTPRTASMRDREAAFAVAAPLPALALTTSITPAATEWLQVRPPRCPQAALLV
jgi:hypothetical protein